MSTVISGPRVKFGATTGDVRVARGGKLLLIGYVGGTLTIASGGYAFIFGMTERLVVEPGGKATLRGYCRGDAANEGGDLTVLRGAVIDGTLHGRAFTQVDPAARIGADGEPNDPETGQIPLPEADELARTVVDDLTHTRWAEVIARFDETLRAELSEKELAAGWRKITRRAGTYQGRGETHVARRGDLTVTTTPLAFATGEFVARITFRDDHTIAGLYLHKPDPGGWGTGPATT